MYTGIQDVNLTATKRMRTQMRSRIAFVVMASCVALCGSATGQNFDKAHTEDSTVSVVEVCPLPPDPPKGLSKSARWLWDAQYCGYTDLSLDYVFNAACTLYTKDPKNKTVEQLDKMVSICRTIQRTDKSAAQQHRVARDFREIASKLKDVGEVYKAEALLSDAISIQETLDSPSYLVLLSCDLAMLYLDDKNYSKATTILNKVNRLQESSQFDKEARDRYNSAFRRLTRERDEG
jgi:hypothetical protein